MDIDMEKVEEKIEYLSSDPETIALYKARERSLHDRANMISGAREEGISIGVEKGAAENAIKGAERMLKRGYSVEDVVGVSVVTEQKITSLLHIIPINNLKRSEI